MRVTFNFKLWLQPVLAYSKMPARQLLKPLGRLFPNTVPRYRLKRSLLAGLVLFAVVGMFGTVNFVRPQSLAYRYAGDSCITLPALFPGTVRQNENSTSYDVTPQTSLSVAGFALYSHRTCAHMKQPVKPGQTTGVRLSGGLLSKSMHVTVGPLPQAKLQNDSHKPISVSGRLNFKLDQPDETFDYSLAVNGIQTKADCRKYADEIACGLASLKLAQTTAYDFQLQRQFREKSVGTVAATKLTTVQSVNVAGSSIAAGQIVYDQPTELIVRMNRPISKAETVSLVRIAGDKREPITVRSEVKGPELFIHFDKPLPRLADLTLTIDRVVATDEGYLNEPFVLLFKTSGGPKVTASSTGASRVAPGSNITLQFDSELLPGQNLAAFVKVEAGNTGLAITPIAGKQSVSFRLPAMAACTTFTIRIVDGLQNIHGITGGSAWQMQSRLLCQSVGSIGASAQGRAITSYKFGSGPSHMIFVGGTHGDEKSSVSNLQSWVDHLESNPGLIPSHRSITIIPVLNPDGYAANRRTNANNVDLNRNFPTGNWKQSVVMPDKSTNPNGGGSAPLSEPESRALANYTTSLSPRLVLTYHAKGGVVIPNDSGDSASLAQIYDKNSNLYFRSNSSPSIFDYDTTGAYEDWLHEKIGIPTLLIEHVTSTSNEFGRNLPAMKLMLGL